MLAPMRLPPTLPDTQEQRDTRGVAIDAVGIRGLRHPVGLVAPDGSVQHTVGTFDMRVRLPADRKGTHMSRFVEVLQDEGRMLDAPAFEALVFRMLERLGADAGHVRMAFPYFHEKRAPVSGAKGLLDCDATWHGRVDPSGTYTHTMTLAVPATSLCPCSKSISRYGAHNQRSMLTLSVTPRQPVALAELVEVAEQAASCATYPLLKRPDEKYVTERAYENARFVEDMVREVVLQLSADRRIAAFEVEVENFESIHNHSAVARVAR